MKSKDINYKAQKKFFEEEYMLTSYHYKSDKELTYTYSGRFALS